MKKLNALSALDASRMISRREITAEALVRDCLERIRERDADVGAWIHCDPELALRQARLLDSGPVRGLLHGLPLGVKDIFDTHDMPTGYGSPIYDGHRTRCDAASVALARAAGGVILGKTVTTEFATFPPGKTRNPLDPGRTPGGSSSGSAAAVADFQVPLAFGTQTAGSVIRPASYCGVVGFKPTYNLIPRCGVKPGSDTVDTVGVFARTVPDAAMLTAALMGNSALMVPEQPIAPPRIGWCRTHEWDRVQAEMAQAMEKAAATLSAAGARVTEMTLPPRFAGLLAAQKSIMGFEGARSRADEFLRFPDKLSAALRENFAAGYRIDHGAYANALALGRECRSRLEDAFGDCDVLLAPSATGEAPAGLSSTGDPVMNQVWTLLHVPCVTVPATTGPNGLPLGLSAVGRIGDDARTLAAAHWIAQRLST